MFCDGESYVRGLLQRSTRGQKSIFEGQLCALSFSTLQTVENVSVNILRSSPVSTLLLSCAPGGGVKSSEAGAAMHRRRRGVKSMTCWALSRSCLFARRPEVLW